MSAGRKLTLLLHRQKKCKIKKVDASFRAGKPLGNALMFTEFGKEALRTK